MTTAHLPSGETLLQALKWIRPSHPSQLRRLSESARAIVSDQIHRHLSPLVARARDWGPYQSVAAQVMSENKLLSTCDLDTLLMVFTVHLRKDRFCEGHFDTVVQSGHLCQLLCRLRQLVHSDEPMTPAQTKRYEQFCDVVQAAVPHLLDQKASALHGAAINLTQNGLMVMGTNPGSGPNPWMETLAESLDFRRRNPQQHAYVNPISGVVTSLHKRLIWAVQQLGHDVSQVQFTNLVFRATADASDLDYPMEAHQCWPVHEWLIRTIQPKLLIVFGTSRVSPFNFLRKHLGWRRHAKRTYPSGHGQTKLYGVTGTVASHELTVVGLPHPSHFNIRTASAAKALRAEAHIAGLNLR